MLKQINLKNFKCFKEEVEFPLNKLNLLTGINGRGKSTLLQSLLLMRQSIEHNEMISQIILNSSCVKLGNFSDVRNSNISREESIVIKYYYDENFGEGKDTEGFIEYFLTENISDDMIAEISSIRVCNELNFENEYFKVDRFYEKTSFGSSLEVYEYKNDNDKSKLLYYSDIFKLIPKDSIRVGSESIHLNEISASLSFSHIHYISADRMGPQEFYFKSTLTNFPNVGARGEFTVNLLYKKADDLVNEKLCIGENAKILSTQTEEWLNEIFDGAKVEIPKSRSNILEPLFNTSASKDRYKPANVGFGYHCILPIVVSGLIAKEGEILIVENPEAHLHPRAQSRLARFLAKVSSCGVQVFIETHSDHILNALRIAVLDKIITNEELSILYFQQNPEQPVVQIPVQPDGGIEEWSEGFFDQMDKDFARLFGL
ncbi:DUF3696 domain-containing protein [Iningainema tapete]|uniref:DUF3696 domain-containing protein n=1 Tax=Iningainema tapete BLCC-T55 TaxID=2748662 RepID=A0A8J7BY13_9CYAN|nr:DUF3696 domain-containing protein [Iningainema tapete]MBD2774812.1 DUF3696 domain-containing protein [Iningainema tapete BLCC-T55]